MKDKLKGLIIGILIGSLATGTTALAASSTNIKVMFKDVGLYLDGTKKTTAKSIFYDNRVYVPVSSIGKTIGNSVGYVNGNIYIGKQPTIKISENDAIELVYKKIKNEAEKYNLHFMIDGEENNKYVVRVFEDLEDHIATYGWYYVNKTTGKVTHLDLITGKEVEI